MDLLQEKVDQSTQELKDIKYDDHASADALIWPDSSEGWPSHSVYSKAGIINPHLFLSSKGINLGFLATYDNYSGFTLTFTKLLL